MRNLIDYILQEPKPCPLCGEAKIYSCFVSWRDDKFLPFWVEMRCSNCGRNTKPKLFRSRAVAQWNRDCKLVSS